MDTNYWQEYWNNYYNFMGMYLDKVQERNSDADIKKEYVEISRLFEPPMTIEEFNESLQKNDEREYAPIQFTTPNNPQGGQGSQMFNTPPFNQGGPGQGMMPPPFNQGGQGSQMPNNQPYVSPGGAQFTINNCRKMAVVRIEMRRGFRPSRFYMIVNQTDRSTLRGFRIDCENDRIRFVPIAIEYRNINVIECAL